MIDFGNGIIAGGHASDLVRIEDWSGVEFPEFDQPSLEHAVRDGGVLGEGRAVMRQMSFRLDFARSGLTRAQMAAAFGTRQVRTMSSEKASIDYKVAAFGFASAWQRETVCAVTCLCEAAYPEGPLVFATAGSATGGFEHPHEYPHTYEEAVPVSVIACANPGEIAAPPIITVTFPTGTTEDLSIITSAGTTVIEGPFTALDVIVVDAPGWDVRRNGATALERYDRDGVWPRLAPGDGAALFSIPVVASVTLRPLYNGLV